MANSFGFGPSNNADDPNDPSKKPGEGSDGGFGFGSPFSHLPLNFNELFAQFAQFGISPETLFSAGSTNSPLLATQTIREIARRFIATQSELPVGSVDMEKFHQALEIAQTWLDSATIFPATSSLKQSAWSRTEWLNNSLAGWQYLFEPLAQGMAEAMSKVISEAQSQFQQTDETLTPLGTEGTPSAQSPEAMALAAIAPIVRSFMGSLIATQLGNSIGQLGLKVTGSHDVGLPLFTSPDVHLLPQNVLVWREGLENPEEEVMLFLALREAASARLFAHTPWLTDYIRATIAQYGKGIRVDIHHIQEQAESAINSGEIDFNNPDSISLAINQGLFTPEQSQAQDQALAKLEMILALIEGWIDHVTSLAGSALLPNFNALNEMIRRRRATASPTQQLFATLLGLEVSPRKTRECTQFWSEVKELRSLEDRDHRWDDPVLLPTAADLADTQKFLESTTAPDDLSGLI